jgi:hypothetical protein
MTLSEVEWVRVPNGVEGRAILALPFSYAGPFAAAKPMADRTEDRSRAPVGRSFMRRPKRASDR